MTIDDINTSILYCNLCGLNNSSGLAVPGIGHSSPDLMLIAEAPGLTESDPNRYVGPFGAPLVGQTGHLLQEVLDEIGYGQLRLFITNVLKHRPPNNRPPEAIEKKLCSQHLINQISILRPKAMLAIGKHALNTLADIYNLDINQTRSHRGEVFWAGHIPIYAVHHPSYIARNIEQRPIFKADLQKIFNAIMSARSFNARNNTACSS